MSGPDATPTRSSVDDFDVEPVRWEDGALLLLDQRLLPAREQWVRCGDVDDAVRCIGNLTVRGAPAIGIAAAWAMLLAARDAVARGVDPVEFDRRLDAAADALVAARPTAVNLAWAVTGVRGAAADALAAGSDPVAVVQVVHDAARRLADSEVAACRQLGRYGAELIADGAGVLTHCNAGALATGGYGSALGVVRAAVADGKSVHVWVDETRPVLQGARLTAWELTRAGIPNTLIVDGAAAWCMRSRQVDVAVVGADRIARNGDVANKIGTYGVALAAAAHDVPLIVAAPVSTIDLACASGADIVIEDRAASEVTDVGDGGRVAPDDQQVWNPAFDVTPAHLVTAVVTEHGVARPPFEQSLRAMVLRPASDRS
jgi:methylthioribose-1-phosphate isomerase